MDINQSIQEFYDRFIGTKVRSQTVEAVEISVEKYKDWIRYFAKVYFKENPPSGESPEINVLQKIFSEIPPYADILCESEEELSKAIRGEYPDNCWRLEDEERSSSPNA